MDGLFESSWWCWRPTGLEFSTPLIGEHQTIGIIRVAGDTQSTLVVHPMMPRTQRNQIPSIRRATIDPMDDVMNLDHPIVATAGDTAALVAQHHDSSGPFGTMCWARPTLNGTPSVSQTG